MKNSCTQNIFILLIIMLRYIRIPTQRHGYSLIDACCFKEKLLKLGMLFIKFKDFFARCAAFFKNILNSYKSITLFL